MFNVANRCRRLFLKSDLLYRAAARHASDHSNVPIPECNDALSILQAASPRPTGGLRVPLRAWPATPEVDVSVIVPCYNVERFVAGCLGSITSQETSRSFEVIAIDDGSVDSTGKILDGIASHDGRVRVIHQENRGFSGARNRGLSEIRGGGSCSWTPMTFSCPAQSRHSATAMTRAGATS